MELWKKLQLRLQDTSPVFFSFHRQNSKVQLGAEGGFSCLRKRGYLNNDDNEEDVSEDVFTLVIINNRLFMSSSSQRKSRK